jgi:capsular polysaccharide biosynthesis protein
MASKARQPLHQWRKRIMRNVKRLLPHVHAHGVATNVTYETRLRADPLWNPNDLPPNAAAMLRTWQTELDEAYIKRYDGQLSLDGRSGLVFMNGRAVIGSTDFPPRERSPHYIKHWRNTGKKPSQTHETLISLHHAFDVNYFHFFNNLLEKIKLIDEHNLAPSAPLVVSKRLASQRYFIEAAEQGVFGDRQAIAQEDETPLYARTIYTVKAFDCHEPSFEWLCDRLSVKPNTKTERRVYIHRGRLAPNARHFRNQAAIDDLLKAHNIEIFDPQEHSLREQIETFAAAKLVISPHGAGLTNLMFRRHAPCTVIELFNPGLGTPHYFMMSRQRGFDYHYLMNLDERGKQNVANSECDVEKLDALLKQIS